MKVKKLKEILNNLPDNATVIVSEKFGRGGGIQGYVIGNLNKEYPEYVEGEVICSEYEKPERYDIAIEISCDF